MSVTWVARASRISLLAAPQEIASRWWKERASLYDCITSAQVLREAAAARLAWLWDLPVVNINAEMEEMSEQLLRSGFSCRGKSCWFHHASGR